MPGGPVMSIAGYISTEYLSTVSFPLFPFVHPHDPALYATRSLYQGFHGSHRFHTHEFRCTSCVNRSELVFKLSYLGLNVFPPKSLAHLS